MPDRECVLQYIRYCCRVNGQHFQFNLRGLWPVICIHGDRLRGWFSRGKLFITMETFCTASSRLAAVASNWSYPGRVSHRQIAQERDVVGGKKIEAISIIALEVKNEWCFFIWRLPAIFMQISLYLPAPKDPFSLTLLFGMPLTNIWFISTPQIITTGERDQQHRNNINLHV